jgi:hypothetical protein
LFGFAVHSLLVALHPDVFRHLRHQAQPVKRGFVDASHLVIHEKRGQQNGHAEYLRAVLAGLVVRVDAFGVEEDQVVRLAVGRVPGAMKPERVSLESFVTFISGIGKGILSPWYEGLERVDGVV